MKVTTQGLCSPEGAVFISISSPSGPGLPPTYRECVLLWETPNLGAGRTTRTNLELKTVGLSNRLADWIHYSELYVVSENVLCNIYISRLIKWIFLYLFGVKVNTLRPAVPV